MKVEKYRDLTLLYINEDIMIAIACDSCGAIGAKDQDVVKVEEQLVGYLTAGVILSELFAFRAKPITIVNNFCVEMKPTGEKIIGGIKKAIEECGLSEDTMLTGSTEENIPVLQTSIGITGVATIDLKNWTMPKTYEGDSLFLVGTPKVGKEVIMPEVSSLKIISLINNEPGINEILPVGSKGIDYEANELCSCNDFSFQYAEDIEVDIKKSAGPGTCFLVSGQKDKIIEVLKKHGIEPTYLGKFIK